VAFRVLPPAPLITGSSSRLRSSYAWGRVPLLRASLFSTEKQADKGVSLNAQRAKVAAYAELYDLELVETIVDAGESAGGQPACFRCPRCGALYRGAKEWSVVPNTAPRPPAPEYRVPYPRTGRSDAVGRAPYCTAARNRGGEGADKATKICDTTAPSRKKQRDSRRSGTQLAPNRYRTGPF
jgi:hypothetical protein